MKTVDRALHRLLLRAVAAFLFLLAATGATAPAQNPTSATNPFLGSVTTSPATQGTLHLTLDEAIRRGLQNNLGLKEAENNVKALQGERKIALQQFLPEIAIHGDTGVYQHNLVAFGFKPSLLKDFSGLFPGGVAPSNFSFITRDDLTQGQIQFRQTLFSGPVIAAVKAAGSGLRAADHQRIVARGTVVQQVATAYLRAIAAASQVTDACALVAQAQVLLDHQRAAHEAGTVAHLEELRAQVQLQAQQQALISAQNEVEKSLILLKREIGIDPGQQIELTDPAPSSELTAKTREELLASAYKNRHDYLALQNQAVELKAVHQAYRARRLPTLSFQGYWGTATVNGAGTHGTMAAVGTLSVPLFREARLRGDEEASRAQLEAINNEVADLRERIDEQIRMALLDLEASRELVAVARSTVELSTRALSDETERVNAGIDNNLPLVTAQATLASAESNLVESLYQYNSAKLALAAAAGVIESRYREYLGR
jgi:outer membrane protein TolC